MMTIQWVTGDAPGTIFMKFEDGTSELMVADMGLTDIKRKAIVERLNVYERLMRQQRIDGQPSRGDHTRPDPQG